MTEKDREIYEAFGMNPDSIETIETVYGTTHIWPSSLLGDKD